MQALLSELTEHSEKVEDLKKTLKQLITENPDSPEAETWTQQLKDIGQWKVVMIGVYLSQLSNCSEIIY